MDRAAVAAYYQGKGYQVHDSIVVTGQSGNPSRVPLLCEGPLGNLAVFFGDAGGIDGHEIGAAKRVARDLGATAVVAAGAFTSDQRVTAADLGVVLVDEALLAQATPPPRAASTWPGHTPTETIASDLAAHPWPASGRPGGRDVARLALTDIDEVLGRDASPANRAQVPAPQQGISPSTSAAPPPPRARSSDGGLWRSDSTPRQTEAAQPNAAGSTTGSRSATPNAGSGAGFSWLTLPPAPAQVAEVELDTMVQARSAPTPLTPEQLAAQRQADLLRKAQLRVLVRRGTWILSGAVFVYLFLLWWL